MYHVGPPLVKIPARMSSYIYNIYYQIIYYISSGVQLPPVHVETTTKQCGGSLVATFEGLFYAEREEDFIMTLVKV